MAPSQPFRVSATVLLSLMAVHTGVHAAFVCNDDNSESTAVYNAPKSYVGCYLDPKVTILTAAKLSTIGMTPQYCANWCGQRGFTYGGIEFGT